VRVIDKIFSPRWEVTRDEKVISPWFWYSHAQVEADALNWIAYLTETSGQDYHIYSVRRINAER